MAKEQFDMSHQLDASLIKKKKPATSQDVALRAGVSQSSVCRVFDSKWNDRISPALREKVLSAAKELGYSPNAIARSLTAHRSGIVGVIVSEYFNEFYYDLLRRITNELQQLDMRVMVFNAAPYRDVKTVFQKLSEYRVDGIIATAAAISNVADPFKLNTSIPLVLVNIYSKRPFCNSVITDNYSGSWNMAHYLYQCGCRNFVYVSAENSQYFDIPDRRIGFTDYLNKQSDITIRHFAGDYSYKSGQEVARNILQGDNIPDCIFCSGSRMAYGVMDVARHEFGLSIPEDISVAAYDDTDTSSLDSYQLTAVQQPSEELALTAVQLLKKQLDVNQASRIETIYAAPSIIVRKSVRNP